MNMTLKALSEIISFQFVQFVSYTNASQLRSRQTAAHLKKKRVKYKLFCPLYECRCTDMQHVQQ